mmetsp:Transcript_49964/g.139425  ORF Transcript_49964/g.139425 Transcript_49964/m.139425 type:complete len:244 (+) Transcript_49964:302-1033(+)
MIFGIEADDLGHRLHRGHPVRVDQAPKGREDRRGDDDEKRHDDRAHGADEHCAASRAPALVEEQAVHCVNNEHRHEQDEKHYDLQAVIPHRARIDNASEAKNFQLERKCFGEGQHEFERRRPLNVQLRQHREDLGDREELTKDADDQHPQIVLRCAVLGRSEMVDCDQAHENCYCSTERNENRSLLALGALAVAVRRLPGFAPQAGQARVHPVLPALAWIPPRTPQEGVVLETFEYGPSIVCS